MRSVAWRRSQPAAQVAPAGTSEDLVLRGVDKGFGGVRALRDLTMRLPGGTVSAIIGPNGAGKTTLFNVITGFTKPDKGQVFFGERDITWLRPHAAVRLGIVRTFQDLKLFENLSAMDNLGIAGRDDAASVLDRMGLRSLAPEITGNLPYASQKLVALARALAARPRFLLLDEPTSGLDQDSARLMLRMIRALAEEHVGVCLIEHNLEVVKELDPHILCLHLGSLFAEGQLGELERRKDVDEIFFGTADVPAGAGAVEGRAETVDTTMGEG